MEKGDWRLGVLFGNECSSVDMFKFTFGFEMNIVDTKGVVGVDNDNWLSEQMLKLTKYEEALKEIQKYAQECYRKRETPMAWRIAEMTHEALKE